jgi:hypothetical protein
MNSQEVVKTIEIIKNIIKNIERQGIIDPVKKENYFWNNHSDITNKYPFLVSQLCSNADNSILESMIEHLKNIDEGKITKKDADKSIGDELSKKFNPPK